MKDSDFQNWKTVRMLPIELFNTLQLSEQNTQWLQLLIQAKLGDILAADWAQQVFTSCSANSDWTNSLGRHIEDLHQRAKSESEINEILIRLVILGTASLCAFLQANVTGPPLSWNTSDAIFKTLLSLEVRTAIISSLSSDGEAIYHLAPHIELFSVAKALLTSSILSNQLPVVVWARLNVNFWHQQLLNETSPALQNAIEADILHLDPIILNTGSTFSRETQVLYLLERANINIFHGMDKKARGILTKATSVRGFEYILTGKLGRRTKFQQFDISQLVVLAKSVDHHDGKVITNESSKPESLILDDDTLLNSIAFTGETTNGDAENIPPALLALDPANQPQLNPIDSIILLSVASSITNNSPLHGLTREETLPYATRVLDDKSTNWQLYTQALLVRSRIEGYKTRTIERGVLQFQALVDQVIAETSGSANNPETDTTTFLPRPKPSESASPSERLLYIDQLGSPLRWSLEAELASKWVSLGGLRTALEIFERLQMWAEAALCWAATDREDKARKVIRRQLYMPSKSDATDEDAEEYLGKELDPLPADAPRLFCILGDVEKQPEHYKKAWEVSKNRFARAQRSLGKHYVQIQELEKADEAYSKSVTINPQNSGTWFSLGCVRLETRNWSGAVAAFTRMIQLEPDDAEAWSNLAAALLRLPRDKAELDEAGEVVEKTDPQKHIKEAFVALKRASTLKRESYRIWQNLMNVAATITPPPYSDLIIAQQRLIELRSDTEKEGCIDIEVVEGILSHIIANQPHDSSHSRPKHGIEKMFTQLIWKQIVPLITSSRRLWQLVARLAIFEHKPTTALDAYEKAWRTTLNKPGWDDSAGTNSSANTTSHQDSPGKAWAEVVSSTIELVDAYESLGEKKVTEGLAAGSEEVVCKNWRYKAKMAVRSVNGRRTKAGFDDIEELRARAEGLKE